MVKLIDKPGNIPGRMHWGSKLSASGRSFFLQQQIDCGQSVLIFQGQNCWEKY